MSADSETLQPSTLDAAWRAWLADALGRGCAHDDLRSTMVGNGFSQEVANRAIAESLGRAGPRIPDAGSVFAHDRDVGIGFAMRDPNVALFEDLLAADECDALIELSRAKLQRSVVVDRASGGTQVSDVRTSEGTFIERAEQPLIARIEARIAAITGVPVENGEPIQVLRYGVGARYLPHHDYFEPGDPGSAPLLAQGGQRIATVVMYLNDVAGGGDTLFPKLRLSIRARRGNAAYFDYLDPVRGLDVRSLHGGSPVTVGEKWVATKWMREGPYLRHVG